MAPKFISQTPPYRTLGIFDFKTGEKMKHPGVECTCIITYIGCPFLALLVYKNIPSTLSYLGDENTNLQASLHIVRAFARTEIQQRIVLLADH